MRNFQNCYILTAPMRKFEGLAVKALLERGKPDCIIESIIDTRIRGPWAPYETSLKKELEAGCSKRFILFSHDDIGFPLDILESVDYILDSAPDNGFISFYNPTNKGFLQAMKSGKNVYKAKTNFWSQFHAFPVCQLQHYLDYNHEFFPDFFRTDDTRSKKYCIDIPEMFWYNVVPSLTQHLGAFRSAFGIPGKTFNVTRNSSTFIPEFDVKPIDWKQEFENPFTSTESKGLVPFEGYRRGMDENLWMADSGMLKSRREAETITRKARADFKSKAI